MKAASAEVVIPGIEGEFSYLVPRELSLTVQRGSRVLVPFRSRRVTGFVIETHPKAIETATRSIEQLLDDSPAFSEELLSFTRWMSDYYLCTWGDALRAALPAGLDAEDQFRFTLTEKHRDQLDLGSEAYAQEISELLDALEEGPLTARQVHSKFGIDPDGSEIRALKQSGQIEYKPYLRGPRTNELVERILELSDSARDALLDESLWTFVSTRSAQRLIREIRDGGERGVPRRHLMRGASKQRRLALEDLIVRGFINERKEILSRWKPEELPLLAEEPDAPLTPQQGIAFRDLKIALDAATYRGFLLYGVTGSGKTRVYIEAIKHTLALGRTALVLVPEISLTPILWGRFRAVFGEEVAIQHSAQPAAVRYDLWRDIARGQYRVVIGARSAVFSPLPNLGLVVVDEEHEASYKQTDSVPRYSARDAALFRARQANAVTILGSATPSLESLFAVEQAKLSLLTLPERISGALLPRVELIKPEEVEAEETKPESEASDTENKRAVIEHVLSQAVVRQLPRRSQQANRLSFCKTAVALHRFLSVVPVVSSSNVLIARSR